MVARRAGSRSRLAVSGTLVAVVALIVLTAPFGGASATKVKTPPFTGATPFAHHAISVSSGLSCLNSTKAARIDVAPRAYLATGKVVSASTANGAVGAGSGCKPLITTGAGFYGLAFQVKTTGAHQITFKWQVSWNISATHTGCFGIYNCPTAAWKISLFANVYDNTTGSWVLGGGSPNDQVAIVAQCSSNCPAGYSSAKLQNYSLIIRANLTSGDRYLIFSGLSTYVGAYETCATTYGSCAKTTSVQVDVGSHSHGAWLRAVKIA